MKKLFVLLLISSLVGCSKKSSKLNIVHAPETKKEEIIDLTKMSSTMKDAQLVEMQKNYDKYQGKLVKVQGEYIPWNENGIEYHNCIFSSSCCPNGIEFKLKDNNYPEENTIITIQGKFNKYSEYNIDYFELVNSELLEVQNKESN